MQHIGFLTVLEALEENEENKESSKKAWPGSK